MEHMIAYPFFFVLYAVMTSAQAPCTPSTFYMPPLNSTPGASSCQPVPLNAIPTASGLAWQCLDGTVGSYGMRKYNLPCSAYSFSGTWTSSLPCGQYASATLSEGYTNYGWCVSCQTPGNCPGAWAQVDLGLVGNVAGLMVSGRNFFCNYPLTILVQYSVDSLSWTYVDDGYVFSTGLTSDANCVQGQATYNIQRPLSTLTFQQPIMARYLRVFPLAHTGMNTNLYSCMTFEPLAVSEAGSTLLLMYPFTGPTNFLQNMGWLGSPYNLNGPGTWSNGQLLVTPGQVMTMGSVIDLSQVSEFTLTYWMSVQSYSCSASVMALGLLDDLGHWFYGVAPCYGTSFMKVTVGGTNTVNGFGWGQNANGLNMQIFHGRRSGNTNYFWVGQPPGTVYASNGMSNFYEFFNLPRWPLSLQLSVGSPAHPYIIKVNDIRLYRDTSVTGYIPGVTGSVPFGSAAPSTTFPVNLNYCAICQPGFYCFNNQVFACPPNSTAGFQAVSVSQCICTPGLFKDPLVGCRACRIGYYCPNQNTETPCSGACVGFTYQSSACTKIADRVCTACPSTAPQSGTPAACVCPANFYNNGTGQGCSACPANAVSLAGSYGLTASCQCLPGYYAFNNICNVCPTGYYSLLGTKICFPFPPGATALTSTTFTCPNVTFLPTSVPVMVNSTGYPLRPGLLYWNFDSPKTGLMNLWGNYTPNSTYYPPPLLFPNNTTPDIVSLSPNLKCKFGPGCMIISYGPDYAVSGPQYSYFLPINAIPMTGSGLTVSFWLIINNCGGGGCNWAGLIGTNMWTFGGLVAAHGNNAGSNCALAFTYNSQVFAANQFMFSSGSYDCGFELFRGTWHHFMFVFGQAGNFRFYLDGTQQLNVTYNKPFPSTMSGSFFGNPYPNGIIDDFAIFQGDMSPYIANFLTNPANLVLNGTAIGGSCVPCFVGMYCNNNTANMCPANTTTVAGGTLPTDCLCNASGVYGTNCSIPCLANNYCVGGGYPMTPCIPNTFSPVGSSQLSSCSCYLPFTFDGNKNCVCILASQVVNTTNSKACACAPKYIQNMVTYSVIPATRPEANCPPSTCSYSAPVGSFYSAQWDASKLFDGNPCTSMLSGGSTNFQAVIDLQSVYFFSGISFLPGQSCNTGTERARANYMSINLSIAYGVDSVQVWWPGTVDFTNNPVYSFYNISAVNKYARYVILSFSSPVGMFFSISEMIFNLTNQSFPCIPCPGGYYCADTNPAHQTLCPAGYYCPAYSTAPIPCGFNAYSSTGVSACNPCPNNSYTSVLNATNITQCVCSPGFFNISNNLNAQVQTLNLTIPVSATLTGPNPANTANLPLLWNGNPSLYAANQYPQTQNLVCTTPGSYVQYDMGQLMPISEIRGMPNPTGYTYCYVAFALSTTGAFAGEQTTILPIQCPTATTCGMYDSVLGYYAMFNAVLARYVRWYLNFDGQTNNFLQLSVYQCLGPTCYSCVPCLNNYYCPGTKLNETYVCPNSTFSLVGAANKTQCQCPGNASLYLLPNTNNSFACGCNAGFYYQGSFTPTNAYIGWMCAACPPNMTSLFGAMNYTQCFCSLGLKSVSLGTLGPNQVLNLASPLAITYGGSTTATWYVGNLFIMNDGIGAQANYLNYPRTTLPSCWSAQSVVWVQYDLQALLPLTAIIAKAYNYGSTTYQCQVS